MDNMIFLDDCPYRTKKVELRCPWAVCVETVVDCIKAIQDTDTIKYLLLDHDLGGEVYVDSDREDCGMEVVRWLVAHSDENVAKIETIIVHSMNPPARESMVYALKEAGYNVLEIPFSCLELVD